MSAQATAVLSAPPGAEYGSEEEGLTAYSEQVFGYLSRSDQRRWAATYLRGLVNTPGRKTVRRMAQTLALPDSAPQALQQFITASPWDWTGARVELARMAQASMPDAVWTTKTVLLRKRGNHSVGLRPRLIPGTGRWANCQVGIGLFLSGSRHSVPVAWRLLLDDTWCADPERRRRARIPHDVTPRPTWVLVLEMIDQFAAAGVGGTAPVVFGHDHALGAHRLAEHLTRRGRDFVIEVPADQPLSAAPPRGALPSTPPGPVSDAAALARARCPGTPAVAPGHSHVYATSVRIPSSGPTTPAAHQTHRLVAEVSSALPRPSRFWVTSLRDTQPAAVRTLAHRTAVTDMVVRHMRGELGLLDFEGRSFPGWHHHMTLASAAYLYRHLTTTPAPQRWPGRP